MTGTLGKGARERGICALTFFQYHGVRGTDRIDARIAMLKAALPLTTDAGVLMPSFVATRTSVAELRALIDGIDAYDRVIARVFKAHPDAFIFASLHGAGPTFAPRLPAAVGSDRERYESLDAMQQYLGIAPVTERSGKSKWLRILFRCWKERKPYDEANDLFALTQCKAPLLEYIKASWKSIGRPWKSTFSKILRRL